MATDDGPQRGLNSLDTDSVDQAVQTLRDEGFSVDAITDVRQDEHGVTFDVTIHDANKCTPLREPEGTDGR